MSPSAAGSQLEWGASERDDLEHEDEREQDATDSESDVSWVSDADVPQSGPNWYSGWELAR